MKTNLLIKFFLTAIILISFTACEEEDNTNDDLQHGLTANAGIDQAVEVGQAVQLSAEQSEDALGEGFDVEWSFVSVPSESEAGINDSESLTASFTPDLVGAYVIKLTISNDLGESEDEVTITADEGSAETQNLSGSYDDDLHLENIHADPELPDYVVVGDVQINAELIIDPGVRIEVEEDLFIDVTENASLAAEGTTSEPIILTTADLDGGKHWKGMRIKSTHIQNIIQYVTIEYAGNSEMDIGAFSSQNRQANLGIDNNGVLSILNSIISNSKGYGLVARGVMQEHTSNSYENNGQAGIYTHIVNTEPIDEASEFTGNDYNGVEIYESELEQDITWAKLNGDLGYKISGDIEINAELSISEGVFVELTEDVFVDVTNNGIIMANGTANQKITFTSAAIASGKYWKGMRIRSTDIRNALNHVVFEYGGDSEMDIGSFSSQNRQTNLGIDNDAKVNINNSEFSNSKGYGLVARGVIEEHTANTYDGNSESAVYTHVLNVGIFDEASSFSGNSHDGPQLYESTLLEEITWSKLEDGAAYKVSGNLDIEAPLFITDGTRIEVDEDVLISVDEGSGGSTTDGYIDIRGSETNQVLFTTSNLAGGHHWKGLRVRTSDSRNYMENVVLEYGGNSEMNIGSYSSQNRATNLGVDSGASLTVTNATIRNSKGWGIAAIASANLTLDNIQYDNNQEGSLDEGI